MTPKNVLKTTGKIVVYFPYWNPASTFGNSHQIQVASPTCTGVLNMVTTIPCTYNTDKQQLTLTNMITSDTTSAMKFQVDNFLNPYSGVPRTGYYVYTTDSNNGQIDSS